MSRPPLDEDDDAVAADVARAIRRILVDHDHPLTRDEAKELEALKAKLPRPSRKTMRDLGRRLAMPEDPQD
ncbi:hypothetical protein [Brevundimonas sp.]|uniref:hypothetical protein n=1 Tax=Brevundimonas sp. TaxID=1871086 RepID=UPI002896865A|nr:hypothetical protein [Brevundimonas sp.]